MTDPDTTDDTPEPAATDTPTEPPAREHLPWDSLAKLAGVRAKLPEDRHQAFDELVGRVGPNAAADLLELGMAPSDAPPAAPATRDDPASGPRSPGPGYPSSREEWLERVRRARQGDQISSRIVDELRSDPHFRGDQLPSNREHANRIARDRANASRPAAKKKG